MNRGSCGLPFPPGVHLQLDTHSLLETFALCQVAELMAAAGDKRRNQRPRAFPRKHLTTSELSDSAFQ